VIYLLDTDTLIFTIRGLKSTRRPAHSRRAQGVVARCRETGSGGDSVGVSAVTVSELEFGARKGGRYETEMGAVRKLLAPFEIYDYDSISCPPYYGRIRYELEAKGVPIGSMDLLIAAHALALDAILVSNSLAHFSRVPDLKTANWISGS